MRESFPIPAKSKEDATMSNEQPMSKREQLRCKIEAKTNEMHADNATIDAKRHTEIIHALLDIAKNSNVKEMTISVVHFETFGGYLDYYLPQFKKYME